MAWQTADQIHAGDVLSELGFGAIVIDGAEPAIGAEGDKVIRMTGRWYESAANARTQSGSAAPYSMDYPVNARVFRWEPVD